MMTDIGTVKIFSCLYDLLLVDIESRSLVVLGGGGLPLWLCEPYVVCLPLLTVWPCLPPLGKLRGIIS